MRLDSFDLLCVSPGLQHRLSEYVGSLRIAFRGLQFHPPPHLREIASAFLSSLWQRSVEYNNRFHGRCCGMNCCTDCGECKHTLRPYSAAIHTFVALLGVRDDRFPAACCHSNGDLCTREEAQEANRPGCRDEVFACTAGHSKYIMSIVFAIVVILVNCILCSSFTPHNSVSCAEIDDYVFSTYQNAIMSLPLTCSFLYRMDT
ncbi:hypothetical protein TSMEX_007615 [Taenia solium]|eukprot:TsM_001066300 transcript=TsM_001066300 gene=TsM_001066300